jgi:hypothetical protein
MEGIQKQVSPPHESVFLSSFVPQGEVGASDEIETRFQRPCASCFFSY